MKGDLTGKFVRAFGVVIFCRCTPLPPKEILNILLCGAGHNMRVILRLLRNLIGLFFDFLHLVLILAKNMAEA